MRSAASRAAGPDDHLGFDEGRPAGVFVTGAPLRGVFTARFATPGFPYRISAGRPEPLPSPATLR